MRIAGRIGGGNQIARLAEAVFGPCPIAHLRGGRARQRRAQRRFHAAHFRVAEIAQVADIGLAVAGQHIEGIGAGQVIAVAAGGLQPARGALQGVIGNDEVLCLGLIEKIYRIDAEEAVGIAAGAPHAEVTGKVLHVQHLVQRRLDARPQGVVARQTGQVGNVIEQQQRLGAAGGLFQAAIGILVQPLQKAGDIVVAMRGTDAEGDAGGGPHQVADQRTVGDVTRTRRQGQLLFAAHIQLRGPHLDGPAMTDMEAAGAFHVQRDAGNAQTCATQLHGHKRPLLAVEVLCHDGLRAGGQRYRTMGLDGGDILAGAALDIVQVQRRADTVAGRQEARQHQIGHHRITHDQHAVGMAQFVGAPGHRHQAQRAIKIRHIKSDIGHPAGAHLHDAAEQRHGALGHHGKRTAAKAVAALLQRTDRALFDADQAAIVIAHQHAQAALAEIIFGRVRRLEVGKLQDALVHRSQCHIHIFAALPGDLHRQGHLGARADLVATAHREAQGAGRIVHPQPGDTDAADGLAAFHARQRAIVGHQHISAGAPFGIHRNVHGGTAGRRINGAGREHLVAGDHHQRLAVAVGLDAHMCHLARRIGGFVGGDRNAVGPVAGAAGRPAGIEAERRGRAGFGIGDGQPISAIGQRLLHFGRAIRADGETARGDQPVAGGGLVFPFAVGLKPLIGGVLAHPAGGQATQRDALAVGVQRDDLKAGTRILGHLAAVEIRADADGDVMGANGNLGGLVGGAPARFVDGDAHHGLQRKRRIGQRPGIAGDGGDAGRVGLRHRQVHLGFGKTVVHTAELPAMIRGIGIEVGLDRRIAIARQRAARCAIQEARFGADMEIAARLDGFVQRRQRHFQALGHEISDVELHPAHRFGLGINVRGDLPAAMRGGRAERQGPGRAAGGQPVAGYGYASDLDAIRALRH